MSDIDRQNMANEPAEKEFQKNRLKTDKEYKKSLYKNLLMIGWPSALEGLLLSLMNSFDTMMVGKRGAAAIAAVGLCGQPRMLLLLVAQGLCIGTTALVARRKGENNRDAAISCMKQSLVVITVIGILMVLIGYFCGGFLVDLAGANDETRADATIYLQTISLAFIANCWTLCICAAQRGVGNTKITMKVNMISNIVNICLNYCLINGHFGFPALGVFGAAIATAIGTVVSSVFAIISVLPKDRYLVLLDGKGLKFDRRTMDGLMKIGTGSLFESAFMRVGFMINARLVAGLGTAAFAAQQIVQQVTSMSFTVGDGIASAGTALIGQSLGEKEEQKARDYVTVGIVVVTVIAIILMIVIFFGRNFFAMLFSDDQEIIRGSALGFITVVFGIWFQNYRVYTSACLRGAGDVKYVAMVALICVAVIRPIMTWAFCYPLNEALPVLEMAYTGAWISFDLDSVFRTILIKIRIDKPDWTKISL